MEKSVLELEKHHEEEEEMSDNSFESSDEDTVEGNKKLTPFRFDTVVVLLRCGSGTDTVL